MCRRVALTIQIMNVLKGFIRHGIIVSSISGVILLIIISVVFFFTNKSIVESNTKLRKQTDLVQEKTRYLIRGVVQRLDVGVRGYALSKNATLLKPVALAKKDFKATFDTLEMALQAQQYPNMSEVAALKTEIQGYIDFCDGMAAAVQSDSMTVFQSMFAQDLGTALWYFYEPISKRIFAFETGLNQQAEEAQRSANTRNVVVQLLLLLVGVPVLCLVIYRLTQMRASQHNLLLTLAQNNRQYLFDSGQNINNASAHTIVENSIENFRKADEVISALSEGSYTVEWQGLNAENRTLNAQTLAGKLTRMKEKMQAIRREEEQRTWVSEGLAEFSVTVRNHQHDVHLLSLEVTKFLVKYIQAQQGALFVTQQEMSGQYLELTACYAFDRKKYVKNRIQPGEGLVGQAYLEGETVLLTQIPVGYTAITSGLGESTPRCLVLVPMKYNDKVEGILEIASFTEYEPFQVGFLEKAGEFVASALTNVKSTEKMKYLLAQSQEQAESLKSQEEELRQNLEELAATQEEMLRQEKHTERQRM